MKRLQKKLSVILVISLLMTFGVVQTNAIVTPTPTYYAYSVGSVWPNGDNFRTNAINAGNIYRTMSSITGSYYNDTPTYAYFTGNNPGGTPRIASRLVFLNGHANSDYIFFSYNDSSGVTQECAVRKSTNGTFIMGSSTYYAAGLSSVDMSTCYLISFVGCGTAAGTSNLKTKAIDRGAQYSLGFTTDITSRFGNGPAWLNAFNNKIADGYDPYNALYYAVSLYPSCDLSLYGDVDMKPIPGTVSIEPEITIQDVSDTGSASTDSISVDSMKGFKEKVSLKDHQKEFSGMIQKVKNKNSSFDPSSYKAYVNSANENENSGVAVFYYCIGGVVETNNAYTMEFKNGKGKTVNESKYDKVNQNTENRILNAVNLFKSSEKYASMQVEKTDTVNVRDRFFFDNETNELKYEVFTFTKTEKAPGVFVTDEGYSSYVISY